MLISALLAMVRGFMREVLSIASWAAAAVVTLYALPTAAADRQAILHQRHRRRRRSSIGGVFLVTLLDRLGHHDQDLRHDPRQPDRRARPHARLPVRARRAAWSSWSWPSCSSPGWCPTKRSPNGCSNAKSQRRAAEHRRLADVDVAGRPGEHHLEDGCKRPQAGDEQEPQDAAAPADRASLGPAAAGRNCCCADAEIAAEPPAGARKATMMDQRERPPRPTRIASTSRATACARSAACSASSAIRTPPRSRRSACTRCSIAARKPPASSSFDGKRFHSERRMGLVGDTFSRREVIDRLPGHIGDRPCPLFDHRRDHPAQRAAAVRRARRRRLRRRPQRQPHQRPDAAPPAGARRRDHAVDHRHRGDPAPGRALAAATASSTASSTRCAQLEGAYSFVGADQQEADRRARPARHPPAGARRARRPPDPRLGDLRARHHRRALRARRRERRGRGVRRGRRAVAQAVPADGAAPLHLRVHLFRAAGFDRRRPRRSTTCARRMGAELAREAPAAADVVVPVPDSGVPAAIGYAQASRHPLRARHHPQPLCRPHLHRADAADPPARRAAEAQRQPRGGRTASASCWSTTRSCAAPPRSRSCR